ncbi:helix-turn-helix domain-containing protein [Streptomyces sp. 3MP-14]|uniref:Helix-turn-helix domain-containing protein n=1 Tax=Streptomyces mimosae TaxID=2586635 RepID=A0A5N6AER5_9ACTN|nr:MULTISPECIES: helix-turn-helix transcriptional regulator [Streptomyces]KAB8166300.1 helix-turn-helix domain-containing protein [Streptomyces mimosae]KAB8174093.1 helix-turn-helix domain-containing protein [Streptomyces sp. 3MP-14]
MSITLNTNAIYAMRTVGEELKRLRLRANLRQLDAAKKLGVTRFTVSKMERGAAFPTDTQLKVLGKLYNCDADERAWLKAMTDQGRMFGRAWWEEQRFRDLFKGDSFRYFHIEDAAERLICYSGTYVPGLLQTREYAEAVAAFEMHHESAERRESFVESRERRQAILTRNNPTVVDLLCLESALRAIVGGPEVMRAQLRRLIEMSDRPNITFRVIPYAAGVPSIVSTLFTIVDFAGTENRSVVSQEKLTGEMLHDDPVEVRRTRRKFNSLADHALNPTETLHLLRDIEKETR